MVKKSETTSQQRLKVVILREIGYSWDKIIKNWDLPPDLQPNQYTQIILKMAAWDLKRVIAKDNKSSAEHIRTILTVLVKKLFARRQCEITPQNWLQGTSCRQEFVYINSNKTKEAALGKRTQVLNYSESADYCFL